MYVRLQVCWLLARLKYWDLKEKKKKIQINRISKKDFVLFWAQLKSYQMKPAIEKHQDPYVMF